MLSKQDLKQLEQKGISEEQLKNQLENFKKGFPFLKLEKTASTSKGILHPSKEELDDFINEWDEYLKKDHTILKFVPASGAASRMFKNLFGFLNADYNTPQTDFEKTFFNRIKDFAFYDALNKCCLKKEGKDIDALINEEQFKTIVDLLLNNDGLNYGQLPKGLLLFHAYPTTCRTPLEEHLVEGALYTKNKDDIVNIHFTVSPEHKDLFKKLVEKKSSEYEKLFDVKYNISFSEQKSSTDTIAVDLNNNPLRINGKLQFRPGGHGALIENLNEQKADIVFIKNIDNVVPDKFKNPTITYKQVIAGILIQLQKKIFEYLKKLDSGNYTVDELLEMIQFLRKKLYCKNPETKMLEDTELAMYLRKKLNRPIRVCGMVKNVGEPGGGPFLAYNQDGTISLQILESSQIDMENDSYKEMFKNGTHFNPVDLVCGIKNYKGEAFNLPDYVDKLTGFISYKSKNGIDLKALELPGLWNGAMSDWNTIFVEVPLETFNPVKTVNDLLRDQHQ